MFQRTKKKAEKEAREKCAALKNSFIIIAHRLGFMDVEAAEKAQRAADRHKELPTVDVLIKDGYISLEEAQQVTSTRRSEDHEGYLNDRYKRALREGDAAIKSANRVRDFTTGLNSRMMPLRGGKAGAG